MPRSINRSRRLALLALLPLLLFAGGARGHHGWGWASAEEFEISGVITAVRLGNPHGELTLDVNGECWVVEIGQPWRNARAGLTDEMLAPGVEVTLEGHRSRDPDERVMKAERVIIAGRMHDLYPDRS